MRGENVDFQGRTVEFKGGGLNFPPLRPDVPIYIASNSPLGLQLAGEVADGVIISSCATQATVDYSLGIISEGASRTGRDIVAIDRVARLNCCIAADPQEALQGVKMSAVRSLSTYTRFAIAAGLEVPPDLTEAIAQLGYTHDTQKLESLARQAPDDLIRDATLAGTIDEVTAKVVSMIESGITQVTIRPSPTPRQGIATTLETFATQVMPQVREQLR
jgi:5,10-methylenetetrahydromethanopterin reductase